MKHYSKSAVPIYLKASSLESAENQRKIDISNKSCLKQVKDK